MTKEARRCACVAASLAVAWNAVPSVVYGIHSGPGTAIYTHFNWSGTVTNVRLVGFTHLTPIFDYQMGDIPAGDQFRTVTLGSGSSGGAVDKIDNYAFVGLGSGTSVWVTFSDPSIALGRSFEDIFGMSEQAVYGSLSGDGTSYQPFLDKLGQLGAPQSMGVECSCVHLSVGEFGGTAIANFSEVPEPGSALVCLSGVGIGFLIRRRRIPAA